MYFPGNENSDAEKSWLACATVSGVVALARNRSRSASALYWRCPGDLLYLFVDAALLCLQLGLCSPFGKCATDMKMRAKPESGGVCM